MKNKADKDPKSMTFMVTKLVTISGCSPKKAKRMAGNIEVYDAETYENKGIYFSVITETIIPVEIK